ncbi:sulfurtransferase [Rothia nasimurium]|uniref:sulfurtransferase n=1 Tax=Rothia nasimurium TaxID=85336 RepID=UPI001F30CDE5|nr:sulfurtransferase [Rothia nasimurium]
MPETSALHLRFPIVGAQWLSANIAAPNLVILDASVGEFAGASTGIPGARRFDIDGEFSAPEGVHTMLEAVDFEAQVRALGISKDAAIVVYDRQGMFSAARGWFMFVAMGHDNVAVLDGGLPAWEAAGFSQLPLNEGPFVPGSFVAEDRGLFVDALTTKALAERPDAAVIDARSAERFAGTAPEPRPGLRAGHIPGSVNLPFTSLLDEQGRFRAPEEMKAAVDAVAGDAETLIFSCGSGVTACIDALAAYVSGYTELAVYDGSWSEWGAEDPAGLRPVER